MDLEIVFCVVVVMVCCVLVIFVVVDLVVGVGFIEFGGGFGWFLLIMQVEILA